MIAAWDYKNMYPRKNRRFHHITAELPDIYKPFLLASLYPNPKTSRITFVSETLSDIFIISKYLDILFAPTLFYFC